jgi:hypothetical protein
MSAPLKPIRRAVDGRRMARRLMLVAALAALAAPLVPVATADAASRAPRVTKVSPLIVSIGRNIYVRGRHFTRGNRRNTVIFQRSDGRAVFARAGRASRTKLVVRVPSRLRRLMDKDEAGVEQPTRFRLRVVSRGSRRAGRPTSTRLSPRVVLPAGAPPPPEAEADCDGDGIRNSADADDDNDLLGDELELNHGLDACAVDTDRDTMEDGFEYWSAKDLNRRAVPYPGKRPYPNPLDGSDGEVDFDGDILEAMEEHQAWQYTGRAYDAALEGPGPQSPLSYSDGTQTSRPDETPAVPAWRSGHYGIAFTVPEPYPNALDLDRNGIWADYERDVDADGLGNWVETHGPGLKFWWDGKLAEQGVPPWPETSWGTYNQRPFADPNFVDPDSDGDTLLDAEDDQDNDDVTNLDESWARWRGGEDQGMNPFNPCGPNEQSRTCPRFQPIEG